MKNHCKKKKNNINKGKAVMSLICNEYTQEGLGGPVGVHLREDVLDAFRSIFVLT
jgi:hypothetical protein